jgi:hypothetical protein
MVSKGLTGRVIPGGCEAPNPESRASISRFRVRCCASPRNDGHAPSIPVGSPVIARSASDEAIHVSAGGGMDCFASLAKTAERPNTPLPSRGAFARVLPKPFALQGEGAGNAGCFAAPAVSCAIDAQRCAHEHTGTAKAFRHSLRSGSTAYAALSLARRIPLASIAGELTVLRARSGSQNLRRLDASHGRQDHTVLPFASAPLVCRAADCSRT